MINLWFDPHCYFSLPVRQDNQTVEGGGEGQAAGGLQLEGRDWPGARPFQHHLPASASLSAHGTHGRGLTQAHLLQCSHLPHQLHIGQQ